jgi:hypothetical protein
MDDGGYRLVQAQSRIEELEFEVKALKAENDLADMVISRLTGENERLKRELEEARSSGSFGGWVGT